MKSYDSTVETLSKLITSMKTFAPIDAFSVFFLNVCKLVDKREENCDLARTPPPNQPIVPASPRMYMQHTQPKSPLASIAEQDRDQLHKTNPQTVGSYTYCLSETVA